MKMKLMRIMFQNPENSVLKKNYVKSFKNSNLKNRVNIHGVFSDNPGCEDFFFDVSVLTSLYTYLYLFLFKQ